MKRTLALLLLLALPFGALADDPPASGKADPGFAWSVEQGTQLNLGDLHLGVGKVLKGPYIDEKNQHQYGLYATLDIAIEDKPSLFQQPDVHDGQTLEVGGYRILIEKILPDGRGIVILRVWGPPRTNKH